MPKYTKIAVVLFLLALCSGLLIIISTFLEQKIDFATSLILGLIAMTMGAIFAVCSFIFSIIAFIKERSLFSKIAMALFLIIGIAIVLSALSSIKDFTNNKKESVPLKVQLINDYRQRVRTDTLCLLKYNEVSNRYTYLISIEKGVFNDAEIIHINYGVSSIFVMGDLVYELMKYTSARFIPNENGSYDVEQNVERVLNYKGGNYIGDSTLPEITMERIENATDDEFYRKILEYYLLHKEELPTEIRLLDH